MKLDHIAINVPSIFGAVQFYKDTFDAKVIYQDNTWAMLNVGDAKIALTMKEEHRPHIAFECSSINDFPDGCELKIHRDGSYYAYINDPYGNIIEKIYYPKNQSSEK